jgi:hypothetical protein
VDEIGLEDLALAYMTNSDPAAAAHRAGLEVLG